MTDPVKEIKGALSLLFILAILLSSFSYAAGRTYAEETFSFAQAPAVPLTCSIGSGYSIASGASFDGGFSVYASAEEQQLVAEILEKDRPAFREILCRDSISPVYSLDITDYRAGDVMTLEPLEKDTAFYFAKVSSAKDMPYDGPAHAYVAIKDGHVVSSVIQYPSKDDSDQRVIPQSTSYADYAEDIKIALGRDSIIPPQSIRMVCCGGLGNCFYINDRTDECLVCLLAIGDAWVDPYRIDLPVTGDSDFAIIRAGEELEAVAKTVKQKKEYVDKNNESGAGESGLAFVPDTALAGVRADHFRDVSDIASYLGQDYRSVSMVFPYAFAKKRPVWPFFAAGGAVVLLAAVAAGAVILVRKKRTVKDA